MSLDEVAGALFFGVCVGQPKPVAIPCIPAGLTNFFSLDTKRLAFSRELSP
jgi:hypothetical protein